MGDFGISQVAGRLITFIGVSGELANGVPQAGSSMTHMSDRGRTDSNGTSCSISGVSILNDVVDSVSYDLGLPHDSWDTCSYVNVVNQLNDIHTLQDCTRVQGNVQQTCALSMADLVHEIASNYDENMGYKAVLSSSAVFSLYTEGLESAISISLNGVSPETRAILVLSIMFKNSTPGVRNVEFRLHFNVSNKFNAKTLKTLCEESSNPSKFILDGTQT